MAAEGEPNKAKHFKFLWFLKILLIEKKIVFFKLRISPYIIGFPVALKGIVSYIDSERAVKNAWKVF